MDLSQIQKDIIVGALLGDGSLEHDKFKASRLQVKQAEGKKEYVLWLYENLANNFGIISSIQTPSSRGKRYTKIYIGKDGREQFLRTINPFILSCFAYKLPPNNLTPQRLILRKHHLLSK